MQEINILEKIEEADMILVGLGEEFNASEKLRQCQEYVNGKALLEEAAYRWLIPMWTEYCEDKLGDGEVQKALERLKELLGEKNYFVVSAAVNPVISQIPWRDGRLVMPCGSSLSKQCLYGCADEIADVTEDDKVVMQEVFELLRKDIFPENGIPAFGRCRQCGGTMILNNVYTENYNESGYLEGWKTYTKWLQGTLNRKLLVLELGVDLRFPSVIRWPFEKVAYFNNKAFFCRVNQKLYQLTEELTSKGVGIPQNAIDWVSHL